MGKTRRRRQHGGGVCKWVLIGALAALSGTPAVSDIGFRGRVSNWWNNPNPLDIRPSQDLANYIVDKKWAPSLNIDPDSCVIPSGIRTEEDVTKVVEPYLKVTVYGMKDNHKYKGKDGRVFELETWKNNQDNTYTLSVTYDDGSSEGLIVNDDDTFEVVPKDGGGKKKRRGQRKTLRRKK
jgi:hypothetical protein